MRVSRLSKQFVTVWVRRRVDPTSLGVEFAFTPAATPPADPVTWVAGAWDRNNSEVGERWLARVLVGPGGAVTLAAGDFDVWIRFSPTPETVVERVGYLEVY